MTPEQEESIRLHAWDFGEGESLMPLLNYVDGLLAEAKAEAWDEGWEANDNRVRSFENPYRTEADE